MKKNRMTSHKKLWWLLGVLVITYIMILIYHQQKPLPDGISYAGDTHLLAEDEIEFLYDLTYQKNGKEIYEHHIFDEVFKTIEQAEEFLIIDMFNYEKHEDGLTPIKYGIYWIQKILRFTTY